MASERTAKSLIPTSIPTVTFSLIRLLAGVSFSSSTRILIVADPVMSYYKFKNPMGDRLTDESWPNLLSTKPPHQPKWVPNFATNAE